MRKATVNDVIIASGVKFGTSGVRGLVVKMTDEICWLYTKAFIQFLEQKHSIKKGSKVAIANDLRSSSPRITKAVIKAVSDSGYEAVYCGEISSPAVMLYGISNEIPSVMVTGSHIPEDRNGIKFNTPFGEVLKEDEKLIVSQEVAIDESVFDENGMFLETQKLPEIETAGHTQYVERFINFFGAKCLNGKTIGLYEHSSVARGLLKEILEGLGAKVILLGFSPEFVSVDTEAIRAEDIKLAKEWAEEYKNIDSIVSTDGDGDRPLVSDEFGNWLKGDIVGVLVAKYMGIDSIVTPVSSNTVAEKINHFKNIERTKIGSPFVIEAMNSLLNDKTNKVAGYEANGGFLTANDIVSVDGNKITALPTRDAVLPILAVILMSIEKQCTISELLADLPARYTASSKIDDFATEKSQEILKLILVGESDLLDKIISEYFDGQNALENIDTTDGVRVTLANEDIVHLRPSGNAPELRCYTESSSEEHAQKLNQYCISLIQEK
ncbi:phosphomannomutase [Francisella adeliensis]|uniref:Phosphomannomutase n=1 Tax=Francisella adeliensis TaxID=2007306 RepID=A0A2Z4XXS2_9GAMM|nr:phosphomannomutase [Francisella adeliensis]AXA33408.1 phosphomannomutase [Francisella adeliensis]MBK2085425.1 phosphomannomutase [Francisella adeliensis]MBK2097155.1 phosphomannomutase [Francisella adeliensis]QIW11636.1 phosphomannomutase [Francisella adeliensis]QIW13511.1 phosphomannomutase [Francisella adeliensis]